MRSCLRFFSRWTWFRIKSSFQALYFPKTNDYDGILVHKPSTHLMDCACYSDVVEMMHLAGTKPPRPACLWSFDDGSLEFFLQFVPYFVLELTVDTLYGQFMIKFIENFINLHCESPQPVVASNPTRAGPRLSSRTNSKIADERSPRHGRWTRQARVDR